MESLIEKFTTVPCRHALKGDQDDNDAPKHLVEKLVDDQQLAKNGSIHNFTNLATIDQTIAHLLSVANC